MKKSIEFLLIVSVFYGVYALFEKLAEYFFEGIDPAFVIFISLLVSVILLLIYRFLLVHEVKTKMKSEVHLLHSALQEKDEALREAQSFKENLIKEAEESKPVE